MNNDFIINIQRGRTYQASYSVCFPDGDPLEPDDGDVMRFAVKEDDAGAELISKTLTYSESTRRFYLTITPEDTMDLAPGRYFFDIGYQSANAGSYDPVIEDTDFIIRRSASQKEVSG